MGIVVTQSWNHNRKKHFCPVKHDFIVDQPFDDRATMKTKQIRSGVVQTLLPKRTRHCRPNQSAFNRGSSLLTTRKRAEKTKTVFSAGRKIELYAYMEPRLSTKGPKAFVQLSTQLFTQSSLMRIHTTQNITWLSWDDDNQNRYCLLRLGCPVEIPVKFATNTVFHLFRKHIKPQWKEKHILPGQYFMKTLKKICHVDNHDQ